jgi:hypothetical protein
MAALKPYPFLLGFIVLFCFVRPTLAFGAGNIAGISKIEGQNCEPLPYFSTKAMVSFFRCLLTLSFLPRASRRH